MAIADLIYDFPSKNADLFYATRFEAHDAILFFAVGNKKYLVTGAVDIDRARREATVDRVLLWDPYWASAKKTTRSPQLADVVHQVLADFSTRELMMPESSSFALVDALRKRGYTIRSRPDPFFSERAIKTREERQAIDACQRAAFAAMRFVEQTLRAARVRDRRLIYRGMALTSERLQQMVQVFFLERGYQCPDPIVASGRHACDAHDRGSGLLRPHESIIVDLFPQSTKTRYFGDTTRTFCKGRAPAALQKLYAAVREGQALGLKLVRPGVNGRSIHEAIHRCFSKRGYFSGERRGRLQGFYHGTGHSIGLEIHEEPARINARDFTLRKGMVMSVEPGLYYPDIGGVRIEDLVWITATGSEILGGSYPKRLEVD